MSFSISIIYLLLLSPSLLLYPFTFLLFYLFTFLLLYLSTLLPFSYSIADNLAIISIIAAWLSSVRSPFFPRAS